MLKHNSTIVRLLPRIGILLMLVMSLTSCKKEHENSGGGGPGGEPIYHTFAGRIGANDNSTVVTDDNGLVIIGNSDDQILVLKATAAGGLQWRKDINSGMGSTASGIAVSDDGSLFLFGWTNRNWLDSGSDLLLIKTDPMGDTLWSRTYGGPESDVGHNIISTSDGGLLMSGRTESFGAGSFGDIYLVKVNTNGDTIWTKTYPDPDQETPLHLLETQNGDYIVSGTNEGGSRAAYLLRVDPQGTEVWRRNITPNNWSWSFSTIELSNSDLMTCGQHTANGHSQVLLIRMDEMGNVIWEREYGETLLSEVAYSVKENLDGTFIITGSCFDVFTSDTDIILLKVDQSGSLLWLNRFGILPDDGTNTDLGSDAGSNLIKHDNDDNVITGNLGDSIFLTRTNSSGVFQ